MIMHLNLLSFTQFKKIKGKQWKTRCTKKKEQAKEEEVTISVGLLEWNNAMLTPAGVLGWLTGQRHRPINGDELAITVMFDHDCLQRNPKHGICFPVVSACGRVVTLPVNHMATPEDFKSVFTLAYCKSQAFGLR